MKKIIDFLFIAPKLWFILVAYFLTLVASAGAIIVVCLGIDNVISYALYGVAGLLLAYSVYTIVKFAPKIKAGILSLVHRFDFTKKLAKEYDFRTFITSSISLAINISYAVFNIVIAIISRSLWFGAIGIYHLFLVLMRSDTILSRKKQEKSSYIRCSIFLILLSGFLALAVWQLVANDLAFIRFGWTIYAYAAVAFYKITMAIISFIKSRKNTLSTRALRFVGLADASVSILTLQTSLLYAFSEADTNKMIPNSITGACVCAFTLALGLVMLITKGRKNER